MAVIWSLWRDGVAKTDAADWVPFGVTQEREAWDERSFHAHGQGAGSVRRPSLPSPVFKVCQDGQSVSRPHDSSGGERPAGREWVGEWAVVHKSKHLQNSHYMRVPTIWIRMSMMHIHVKHFLSLIIPVTYSHSPHLATGVMPVESVSPTFHAGMARGWRHRSAVLLILPC